MTPGNEAAEGLHLRRFSASGLDAFKQALDNIRGGSATDLPTDLLQNELLTERVATRAVAPTPFKNKGELAAWTTELLKGLVLPSLAMDSGLWSWLAAACFDQLCPVDGRGRRAVLATALYVLDAANYQRVYRHLVAGPWSLSRALPDHNMLFLSASVASHPDVIEQISGRLHIIRSPSLREALERLYFDAEKQRPKRGAAGKIDRPGVVRRFIQVVQQFDCTMDLSGMTSDQVIALLPGVFKKWKTSDL